MVYVLSTFENNLDKKGRVSVPSSFRAYLNSMGYNRFITYPSFNNAALDACAQDRIEKLSESMIHLAHSKIKEIILQLQFFLKVSILL